MRIVLIGPPGSGKGTQAYFIMRRYKIPIISIGNILRSMTAVPDSFKNIKNIVNSGGLISDELAINLILTQLNTVNYNKGFLLDGFPRTITQAYIMKVMNITIDFILVFLISERLIIERISDRHIHISSGRIYHPKFNPPKNPGYDDVTGEALTVRKDDTEMVIRSRLTEYYCYTQPVIDFYRKEATQNNHFQYFSINCNRHILDIQKELITILG